jgi:thiamine biosynthesis protein ThiS
MMITVKGTAHLWRDGMTVADLLKELNDPYPYVAVRINGRVISRPSFEKTPIPDGAEIFLIPMIAGG